MPRSKIIYLKSQKASTVKSYNSLLFPLHQRLNKIGEDLKFLNFFWNMSLKKNVMEKFWDYQEMEASVKWN